LNVARLKRGLTKSHTLPRLARARTTVAMSGTSQDTLYVHPSYRAAFRALGLTAQGVFTDPRIVVWRSITERENATLDVEVAAGRRVRLHVKRYRPDGSATPADDEARGIEALEREGIATTPLVAHGRLADGRGFIITEDLWGFRAADKLIAEGLPFETLLGPTADLAAKLHQCGLHHRDLYLCHFFVKSADDSEARAASAPDLRLIDAARVKRLPALFTRRRWIVKDLAQFWYSTLALPIDDAQRDRWLARYAQGRRLAGTAGLRDAIARKVRSIARHDAKLRGAQPSRNISIPGA